MLASANAMNWTSRKRELAAAPLSDCPAELPSRPTAKLAVVSDQDRMMAALLGGVVAQTAAAKKAETVSVSYCREPGLSQIAYGLYRPDGSAERYILAITDAGQAVVVGHSDIAQILSEMKSAPRISVSYVQLEQTITYADFQTLPLPGQVVELVSKSAPLSVASTWGKSRNLTINTSE